MPISSQHCAGSWCRCHFPAVPRCAVGLCPASTAPLPWRKTEEKKWAGHRSAMPQCLVQSVCDACVASIGFATNRGRRFLVICPTSEPKSWRHRPKRGNGGLPPTPGAKSTRSSFSPSRLRECSRLPPTTPPRKFANSFGNFERCTLMPELRIDQCLTCQEPQSDDVKHAYGCGAFEGERNMTPSGRPIMCCRTAVIGPAPSAAAATPSAASMFSGASAAPGHQFIGGRRSEWPPWRQPPIRRQL